MRILALDPGTDKTAAIGWDTETKKVTHMGILPNEEILADLAGPTREHKHDLLAIEMVACYGMPVGHEVFDTCVWIGRFIQVWPKEYVQIFRRDIKLHLCNSSRAKDGNVRQALIDRFGAPGTKKSPGPLYGIISHMWAALAVAVYTGDSYKQ